MMTPTQSILRNFIFFTIGGVSLFACSEPLKEDGEYCFNIEEGETCPDLDTVNADYLPEEPICSTIEYVEATDGPSQSDSPVSVGMEIVEESQMDGCCYTATYREVRDEPECVVGRPLMEDGIAKVADVSVSRSLSKTKNPWTEGTFVHCIDEGQSLTDSQKEISGQFYLTIARYEHASIASFQKFTLDLMRFGAPPHLLDRAQQATRDEIRHAKMAFSIAQDLLQKDVQPSQLDYTPSLCTDIHEFARTTLEEGAIGETLAVLLASEQLRVATDSSIQSFFKQVVEDEAQHAELAWETLRWCLQQDQSVRQVLEELVQKGPQISISYYPEEAIQAVGLPPRKELEKLLVRGFEQVIVPSIQSLLQSVS